MDVCLCVCLYDLCMGNWCTNNSDSERHVDFRWLLTLSVNWLLQQATVYLCAVFVTIKWHMSKKLRPPMFPCYLCISPSLALSFDMLLIWQVKVSFVASTSAFILLSAPSAQWCRSHMLLFHMTVLLLCRHWCHLLSSDHSLDKDSMSCHLPPSCSTSHCMHSFKRASSSWAYESKNHVSFHEWHC